MLIFKHIVLTHHFWRTVLVASLLILFGGHALQFWHLSGVKWIDRGIQDWRQQVARPLVPHTKIVILDIDERSLAEMGRWPWPRDTLAKVLDKLFLPGCNGLQAIGLDMVMAEPDLKPGADDALAAAMIRCPSVLGWYLSSQAGAIKVGHLPMPALMQEDLKGFAIPQAQWLGYTANLPVLDNAASSGLVNGLIDSDGQQRRVPLVIGYQDELFESMAFSLWRSTLPPHTLRLGQVSGVGQLNALAEYIEIIFTDDARKPAIRVPLDIQGGIGIDWRGRGYREGGGFDYVSLTDVMHDRIPADRLRGRIGIVGSTSPGLMDLRATPVNPAFPGVEIHALALASILDHHFLSTPPFAMGWELAMLVCMTGMAIWGLQRLSPGYAIGLTVLLAGGLMAATEWLHMSRGWIMPMASPLMLLAALFLIYTVWGYWSESRTKRQFVTLFGQYVPPQLVQKMSLDPSRYSMAAKQAELTILFSDVRGFTSISEQLSPDDLREFINQYLTAMADCIAQHEGTLDKFIGDAVMAFWGAPVEQSTHAAFAVDAALKMLEASESLSATFVARGWPNLAMGIGLNTGDVRVGDMGSDNRRAYTVMGDPVNLASRLESLTKRYGVGLLVGEKTMRQTAQRRWLLLDMVRVKGKEEPVRIYTLARAGRGTDSETDVFTADWNRFRTHYLSGDWPAAQSSLVQIRSRTYPVDHINVQTLADLFLDRLTVLSKTTAPPDWQGISNFEDK